MRSPVQNYNMQSPPDFDNQPELVESVIGTSHPPEPSPQPSRLGYGDPIRQSRLDQSGNSETGATRQANPPPAEQVPSSTAGRGTGSNIYQPGGTSAMYGASQPPGSSATRGYNLPGMAQQGRQTTSTILPGAGGTGTSPAGQQGSSGQGPTFPLTSSSYSPASSGQTGYSPYQSGRATYGMQQTGQSGMQSTGVPPGTSTLQRQPTTPSGTQGTSFGQRQPSMSAGTSSVSQGSSMTGQRPTGTTQGSTGTTQGPTQNSPGQGTGSQSRYGGYSTYGRPGGNN
jgi:hypothetical protein